MLIICGDQQNSTYAEAEHYNKNMILISSHLFICFLFFLIPYPSYGSDTLYASQSLSGDKTLISKGENFVLGFFKPGNSSNYYIGIWYKKTSSNPPTIVWVANRETPISDRFKSRLIILDGNLVILKESNFQIWSTNITSNSNSVVVVIRDDGNLVLRDESNSVEAVWQSFDHPTDTWLPGSKLKYDNRRNTKQVITSWRSSEDPAVGLFSLEIDPNASSYVLKWNNSIQYWTSGSWNGRIFSLIPEMTLNYIYNFSYFSNENESYFAYSLYDTSVISRFTLDISGQIQQATWLESEKQWNIFWARPITQCQVYASCGSFGTCTETGLPFCNCLTGFQPRSVSDWSLSDFSGGCVRKTKLDCTVKDEDPGFLTSYVPAKSFSSFLDNVTSSSDESACRSSCLDDCTCDAYSFGFKTCLLWNNETLTNISLVLVSEDANTGTISPVNIKVSLSDLPSHTAKINTKALISGIIAGFLGLVFLCSIGIIFYKRRGSRAENPGNLELQFRNDDSSTNVRYLVDPVILSAEDRKGIVVPFFEFKTILSATQNFSLANKLGQGGFGPVYKGMLPGGTEIAVKRLSSQSGQGLKEFKNEVVLIAKLQHRNLVRLVGYSMKDHEMILLYEYMPNKSLDRFIFDRTLCMCLDWAMRFDIIMGIARGLLYLHQDSRLRIIHRDLKTSNVLLDEEMNPKISDFGLAKIIKGRETEASTGRVIGTYGYMSPEYALDGLFSVKSDVFSFGVVVLEIISGKRNTGYYQNQQAFSLISYAWGLWKDKTPLDLLDPALAESGNSIEVLRCMIIGLLCIQEDPQARPTMMDVVLMLGMDIESLPDPKEPAFVSKTRLHSLPSSSNKSEINQLTITDLEGR